MSRKTRNLFAILLGIGSILLFVMVPTWCLVPWACFK